MRSPSCQFSHNILRVPPASPSSVAQLLHLSKQILNGSNDFMRFADYYVFDGSAFQYVFLLVACGHCELCVHSKQLSIINRANLESACYTAPAYMITLTYSSKYLPMNRIKHLHTLKCNTLYYPDVQKFFKRLRIKWTRAGMQHSISYLVAGEYGKAHNRPHYHIIIWNNPYHCSLHHNPWQPASNIINHRKFYQDVFSAWGMCESQSFQCEPVDGGAPAYCSKYLTKQLQSKNITDGRSPYFIHTSHGHGGIGSSIIEKNKNYYRRNPGLQNFIYRNYDGEVSQVPMFNFIAKRLYPSPSQQVTNRYKLLFLSLKDALIKGYSYGLYSEKYVSTLLTQYSLGILYYKLSLSKDVHCPDVPFIDISSRVNDCVRSLLSDLDEEYLLQEISLDNYYYHKSKVTNINTANTSLAFDYLRVRNKQYSAMDRLTL